MAYDNIQLDKGLYTTGKSLTQALETTDPSENYRGTALEGLDAYERQLKRFGIHVAGTGSDRIEKFFRSGETATLFPEYIARAVRQGLERADKLAEITAATTIINGLDYRSVSCETENGADTPTAEAAQLPVTQLRSKSSLVGMKKHGRVLNASYEALRYHRLDLFTVTLRQIGAEIANALLAEAVEVLIDGDGTAGTAALTVSKGGSDLSYADLIALWNSFDPFEMTTLVGSAGAVQAVLALDEMRDGFAGLDFHGSGNLVTPLGARLLKSAAVPAGQLLALDKNCALEVVKAGDILTDYDKLIDHQLDRAAISATVGFAKIFADAAVVLQ
ncbi:MAG: phage major capsid protein [Oscillospiraceae bacterium]|jgi:hypothetical protein|nr:phage major capsid protein [Oscillospiraceae bacterium]